MMLRIAALPLKEILPARILRRSTAVDLGFSPVQADQFKAFADNGRKRNRLMRGHTLERFSS
jgi:hypothetical protein